MTPPTEIDGVPVAALSMDQRHENYRRNKKWARRQQMLTGLLMMTGVGILVCWVPGLKWLTYRKRAKKWRATLVEPAPGPGVAAAPEEAEE